MGKEIERKWKLSCLPSIANSEAARHDRIDQGYVLTENGELRIRHKADKYYLTVKGDGTISRDEWESEIPQWVFDQLWPACQGKVVEKTRHSITYGELTLEIDEYSGKLAGLTSLEVEFADEAQAEQFDVTAIAPDALDVTSDKRYKNKALAVNGLPT